MNGWPGPSQAQQDEQEAAITFDMPGGPVGFTMSDLKALAGEAAAQTVGRLREPSSPCHHEGDKGAKGGAARAALCPVTHKSWHS